VHAVTHYTFVEYYIMCVNVNNRKSMLKLKQNCVSYQNYFNGGNKYVHPHHCWKINSK